MDAVLEAAVAPSFCRVGYDVRSRLEHWTSLNSYDLSERTVVVTGPTSGLGRATAFQLARCGAMVVLWGRDRHRTETTRDELAAAVPGARLDIVVADLADLGAVRLAADALAQTHRSIDALIHNAGLLSPTRQVSVDGFELTVATQVLAPFLLSARLLGPLTAAGRARVLTVSSGGMYSAALSVDGLEMGADYRGATQYARAKRAQVTLNEIWADKLAATGIVFHAMHPGWAATPGLNEALPRFSRVIAPVMRTPEQGSDTLVWLAADNGRPVAVNGGFWHDRQLRPIHRLSSTRRSDTSSERERLWGWCVERVGVDPISILAG